MQKYTYSATQVLIPKVQSPRLIQDSRQSLNHMLLQNKKKVIYSQYTMVQHNHFYSNRKILGVAKNNWTKVFKPSTYTVPCPASGACGEIMWASKDFCRSTSPVLYYIMSLLGWLHPMPVVSLRMSNGLVISNILNSPWQHVLYFHILKQKSLRTLLHKCCSCHRFPGLSYFLKL